MRRLRPLDLAIALAVVHLGVFLYVALSRFTFPFELEWMEGGMLTHAARLLQGKPIYAPPSADFVPFFYTPGYPTLLAWLSPLFGGLTFGLARGVSLVSTLSAMGLLFRVGQREGGHWRYGLLAAGIYAALFRTNGAFYDLARPDALFMALLSGAVYVAYYRVSYAGAIASALLFVLGFFTKQTVSVFVPAVGLFLLWRNWRHALVFGATVGVTAILGVWSYNRWTDGWFWTYIFEGHQGHLFYWKNILMEYWRDVLFLAPLLLLLPLLWFGYKVPVVVLSLFLAAHWTYAFIFRAGTLDYVPHMYYRELFYETPRWQILVPPALIAGLLVVYRALNPNRQVAPRTHLFWLLMFVAGTGASGLNHSTQWAYSNCFMLLSYFAALLIALACRDLTEATDTSTPKATALIPVALVVQLGAWYYSPIAQTPTQADHDALAALDARLAEIDGPVFMPAHPFYAWQRDRQVHVHQMGIQDVAFMGGVRDLFPRLARKTWAAVVVDDQNQVPGLSPGYYEAERFKYSGADTLRSKTGFLVRPTTLYLRQDPTPRALAPGVSANFEEPAFVGWQGTAFSPTQGTRGLQGRRLASSQVGGDQAVGKLVSLPLVISHPRLTCLMGGRGKVGLRVLANGRPVARLNAPRARPGEPLKRVELDTSRFVGQTVTLEIFDEDPRGHVQVDDLRFAR